MQCNPAPIEGKHCHAHLPETPVPDGGRRDTRPHRFATGEVPEAVRDAPMRVLSRLACDLQARVASAQPGNPMNGVPQIAAVRIASA